MGRLLRFKNVMYAGVMLSLVLAASSCSDEQSGTNGEDAAPEVREVTRTVTVAEKPEGNEPPASEPGREAPVQPAAPPAEQSPAESAAAEESPEDVLALQYRLINAGDYDGAYALFDEQSKQLVSPEQYRAYFDSNAPYLITDYSFPSVNPQGDSAVVEAALDVSSASGSESYLRVQELVREGGVWRVVMRDDQASSFVASGAPSETDESAQYDPEPSPEQTSEPADEEIGEVSVRITGDPGIKFTGDIGTLDGSRSVEGTTPQEFAVEVDTGAFAFDSVSALAQNADGSGNLIVQIVRDGEVVKEQSTTAQYGVANVTWSPSE